ncbi:hypothetical protein D6764_04970 [Candidatus Woesearchaeota archaeon]|nr:MAG: hypothetical protein D6764_04970 [Candidatus Woesearchaeota archaeon]
MADENPKRQVAVKVRIKDILDGRYVKEEGWEPNYVELPDGRKCSRANIIGVIIEKPEATEVNYDHLTIDDGTGSILIRTFDQTHFLEGKSIGDIVLVVGRPREYLGTKYIMPEIVRKIENRKWVEVRKLELEEIAKKHPRKEKQEEKPEEPPEPAAEEEVVTEEVVVEDRKEEDKDIGEELPKNPYEEIIQMIRDLDRGDGADIEEITATAKVPNADTIIESLLREGEIFEIRPGRLKVLE